MRLSGRKLQILSLLLVHTISGCEAIVDVEAPDFEPALTFDYIYGDEPFFAFPRLELYKSQSILSSEKEYEKIVGGRIAMYENGKYIGHAEEQSPGLYRFNHTPSGGNIYKVVATADGLPQIKATDTTPVLIESVNITDIVPYPSDNFYTDRTYRLEYSIDDPTGKNYYDVKLYIVYSDLSENGQSRSVQSISFRELGTDLSPTSSNDTSRVFTDDLFDGRLHSRTIEFNYQNEENLNSQNIDIVLSLRHCSESYYRYFSSLEMQKEAGDNPFSEPVQVYNNIENGFGIFTTYTSDTSRLSIR